MTWESAIPAEADYASGLHVLQFGVMGFGGEAASRTPPCLPGVRVFVETVLLGRRGADLTYRVRRAELTGEDHPDALALDLAGFGDGVRAASLLHSTSWRYAPGGVVLTYAALPDPCPAGACRLDRQVTVVHGRDNLTPSPEGIGLDNVAVHACRHLAFLRAMDPLVAMAAVLLPELWSLIEDYRPAVAGLLPRPASVWS